MNRGGNQSIAEMTLRVYLYETRELHNGYVYENLGWLLTKKIPLSTIAKLFNVNRNTIVKWVKIYKEEQSS